MKAQQTCHSSVNRSEGCTLKVSTVFLETDVFCLPRVAAAFIPVEDDDDNYVDDFDDYDEFLENDDPLEMERWNRS